MILIKIGWSLIAPKHDTTLFNLNFLKKIARFLKWFADEPIILLHGTWNVWHWFVEQFWLTKKSSVLLRKELDKYFEKINTVFPDFKRLRAIDIMNARYTLSPGAKIISWWDTTSKPSIISSDDLFSHFLHTIGTDDNYILTDVDGVLDKHGKIIDAIDYDKLKKIAFRSKAWDVTWAMWNKVRKLFTWKKSSPKTVWIVNGNKLENLAHIIKHKTWVGTKIYIREY